MIIYAQYMFMCVYLLEEIVKQQRSFVENVLFM